MTEGAEATAAEQKEAIKRGGEQIRRWRESPLTFVREQFKVEPDAWQREVLEAFPHNQRLAMVAPIAMESSIWTPRGKRRWGDLLPGDLVFAEDGSQTTIINRFNVGVVPLFRVRFSDGTSLRVSADHQWDVHTPYDRRIGKRRTVTTAELMQMPLRRQQQWLVSLPHYGAARFGYAQLPADPYIFGLWLGDGIANEPRLICPDKAIRAAVVGRGQDITESDSVPKRIGLKGWIGQLRETSASACRSYEKFIPDAYKISSVVQRLDLLRGLMDSDGTVTKNGQVYLATSSPKLAEDFLWLARSLGYFGWIAGPYKINGGESRDSYRVVISGPECPFHAETAKKKRWVKPAEYKYSRFIEAVEPDGEGYAMCIEVFHPSNCFLADEFILTHNCKGPGKTTVEAWLNWNFLVTRPHPKMAATSISGDNLRDNLWAEMAKWRDKAPMLKAEFEWTKQRIYYRKAEETWFMSARTWPKDADPAKQADTLAGLHADYIMFTLDESGGIPDAVMVAADAALSSCVEGHIVQAGNPTQLSGPLYRANRDRKERGGKWWVINITGDPDDPLRSPRVSVQWAKEQIAEHGRDNPWVLVNVFGQFPPSSFNALIGEDEVRAAMKRLYREWDYRDSAKVLGVDVARFGNAASCIFRRQGLQSFPMRKVRNINSIQGAGLVARSWDDWGADACFVDATGGFGAGWVDQLVNIGKTPIGIQFSSEAHEKTKYYNKRAEMAFDAVQWIKRGGALPESTELLRTLTETTYTFQKDRILLEPKEDIEIRLGFSLDEFDSLILTFAEPVSPRAKTIAGRPKHKANYDPLADDRVRQEVGLASAVDASYDPMNRR